MPRLDTETFQVEDDLLRHLFDKITLAQEEENDSGNVLLHEGICICLRLPW